MKETNHTHKTMARRQVLMAALPFFINGTSNAATLTNSTQPPSPMYTSEPFNPIELELLSVGRFMLVPDAGWVESHRVAKVRGVRLTDLPQRKLPKETEGQDQLLRVLRGRDMSKAPLVRRFEIDGVGQAAQFGGRDGGAWAVLHGDVTMGLLMTMRADSGSDEAMKKTLFDLVQAYRPSTRKCFCLDHGCLLLPPGMDEVAGIVLESLEFPGAEFRFEARAIDKPQNKIEVRNGQMAMTIASVQGMSSTLDAPNAIAHRFWASGVGGNPLKPQLQIELTSNSVNEAQKKALGWAWENMISRIQPIA
jgi:hypothetical protein